MAQSRAADRDVEAPVADQPADGKGRIDVAAAGIDEDRHFLLADLFENPPERRRRLVGDPTLRRNPARAMGLAARFVAADDHHPHRLVFRNCRSARRKRRGDEQEQQQGDANGQRHGQKCPHLVNDRVAPFEAMRAGLARDAALGAEKNCARKRAETRRLNPTSRLDPKTISGRAAAPARRYVSKPLGAADSALFCAFIVCRRHAWAVPSGSRLPEWNWAIRQTCRLIRRSGARHTGRRRQFP